MWAAGAAWKALECFAIDDIDIRYSQIMQMTLPLIMSLIAGTTLDALAEPGSKTHVIHHQPSFVVSTKEVELAVTQLGGHMAPVSFYRDSGSPVQPYHISPWQDEKPSAMPAPVLVPLRGDFFCLPFGGNAEAVKGEQHPPHGEIVGQPWRFVRLGKSGDVTTLTLRFETQVRKGAITKELSLVDGHNVVYCNHRIDGFAGNTPLGHHATLAMPDREGSVRIATSPFEFGMTCPGLFSDPTKKEYQALLPSARWTDLAHVPMAWKDAPDADLSRLPARRGFADLIQLMNRVPPGSSDPAWTTATFTDGGYIWFALKDPGVLRSTVFWIENHGRHGHPWNGRNNCLGLEDVTAFFADGLAASTRANALTQAGIPTSLELVADRPTEVHYIQGVVKVPAGFESVRTLEFAPGKVTFVSIGGQRVTAPVRHEFLKTGRL